jgi:aryl-alcohol dehydrogenase-like predicted oxidoreductase
VRDALTPIEEFVRALDDQVRLGKVLYVGISDSPAWVVGLTVAAWGTLEHGLLSGRPPARLRWPEEDVSERAQAVLDALRDVAEEAGATLAPVAVAWLLARRAPELVPIVGVRSAAQLEENLAAVDVSLSGEQLARLDDAGAPALGFPRSFLESDGVRGLIYWDTWKLLYSGGAHPRHETTAG